MYRRGHRDQLSFDDIFLSFGGKLSGDKRWIKQAELIPWEDMEDDYAAHFCKGFDAPAKPFRMALGALIIKARMVLTDEELVGVQGAGGLKANFSPAEPLTAA